VTASLKKISAGDGYDYLTKQVAAFDDTNLGREKLIDYYEEKGESPGVWMGSGLRTLDQVHGFGVEAGAAVGEEQMKALFGVGRHPEADRIEAKVIAEGGTVKEALKASQLGRLFKDGASGPFHEALAEAYIAWNVEHGQSPRAKLPDEIRAKIRTTLALASFRKLYGRDPLSKQEFDGHLKRELRGKEGRSCAGFDLTFSPVKSISVLWGVGPREVAEVIEQAHAEAVAETIAFLEENACYTRRGIRGARQVETNGLIAAAFTHRDSRAGDPDLHTHVAISNKVQAKEDGAWLALDGRMIYQLTVAASERYNSAMERILTAELGLEWVGRESDSGRREIREIAGISSKLLEVFSRRRVVIRERQAELVAEFEARHLRPPTPKETLALAQQATLETREAKHEARSHAEQRSQWRSQAIEVLGSSENLDAMARSVLGRKTTFRVVDEALIARTAERVVGVVEAARATWQIHHITAEAERQVRVLGVHARHHQPLVQQVIARVIRDAVKVGVDPEEGLDLPAELRRSSGESMYQRAHSQRYTTGKILEAEAFIRDAATAQDGAVIGGRCVDIALLESAANGVELNPAQVGLVREFATSGARVQLALAPAGTGKTTAMSVLSRAWRDGGGQVVAAAPTHIAVDGLRQSMDCPGGTIAGLSHALQHGGKMPAWAEKIDANTLVVVDEAGMAGTLELAGLIAHVMDRGGSVRLIGDHQQLAAVAAGGILRDLAEDNTVPVVRLDEVMRFVDHGEGEASLALRAGDPQALGFYADRGRIHTVAEDTAPEVLCQAWQRDIEKGWTSIMLAATNEQATQLNALAQQYRISTGQVNNDTTALLRDGNHAGIGDIVVTRVNDKQLQISATDWVKNRDRWEVVEVRKDGALTVKGERHGRSITLPATYVKESVELGYAGTVHAAQGVTVDSTHTLIVGTETRQTLYVALSRGHHENHAWVSSGAAEESGIWMETLEPPTPVEVLESLLGKDGQAMSATTEQRIVHDPFYTIAREAAGWQDSVAEALAVLAGPEVCERIDHHIDQVIDGAAEMRGYSELRAEMLALHLAGRDPIAAFDHAYRRRHMNDVKNPVAVMTYRLRDEVNLRRGGPLPSLWGIPPGVTLPEQWTTYLQARRDQVVSSAEEIRDQARSWGEHPADAPRWATPFLQHSDLVAGMAVFRASTGVPDSDLTPLGPKAQFVSERAWQNELRRTLEGIEEAQDARWDVPETVRQDPWWDVLRRRLDAHRDAGQPVEQDLAAALDRGPLPIEHPAAALWYRLESSTDGRYQLAQEPEWIQALRQSLGDEIVDAAADSPDWQHLTEAIQIVTADNPDLADLVTAAAAMTPDDIDPEALSAVIATKVDALLAEPPVDVIDQLYDPETEIPFDTLLAEPPARLQDPAAAVVVQEPPAPAEEKLRELPVLDDPVGDFGPTSKERIIELNHAAANYFKEQYKDSSAAAYLQRRLGTDLTDHPNIVVGHAPGGPGSSRLVDHLRSQGATDQELVDAGLAKWGRQQQLIDVFRDRLILGLHNTDGDLVGFVGRAAPGAGDRVPKYLNTPASRAFHKGQILFGLPEHQELINDGADLVRTEGPFDALAITLACDGKAVGVAPLGTALTSIQAKLIAAQNTRVWEATDLDAAGQKAATKDNEKFLAAGVVAYDFPLTPPDSDPRPVKDPAELLTRPGGAQQLQNALTAATSKTAGPRTPSDTTTLTDRVIERLVEASSDKLAKHEINVRVAVARHAATIVAALPAEQWAHHTATIAYSLHKAEGPDSNLDDFRDLATNEVFDAITTNTKNQQPPQVQDPHRDSPKPATPGETQPHQKQEPPTNEAIPTEQAQQKQKPAPAPSKTATADALKQAREALQRIKEKTTTPQRATQQTPLPHPSPVQEPWRTAPATQPATKTVPAPPAPEAYRQRQPRPEPALKQTRRQRRQNKATRLAERVQVRREIASIRRQQHRLVSKPPREWETTTDRLAASTALDQRMQQLNQKLHELTHTPGQLRWRVIAISAAQQARAIARIDQQLTLLKTQKPTIKVIRKVAALNAQKEELQTRRQRRRDNIHRAIEWVKTRHQIAVIRREQKELATTPLATWSSKDHATAGAVLDQRMQQLNQKLHELTHTPQRTKQNTIDADTAQQARAIAHIDQQINNLKNQKPAPGKGTIDIIRQIAALENQKKQLQTRKPHHHHHHTTPQRATPERDDPER